MTKEFNQRADDQRIQKMHDIIIGEVQPRMKKIDKLDETVNGKEGLVVEQALTKQYAHTSINRLWWVGGGAMTFILGVVGLVAAFG